jgi:hypothetical protein
MVDDTRSFPVQGERKRNPKTGWMEHYPESTIPWWLAEEAYQYYAEKFGTSQSLERLAERGGFGRHELLMLLRREEV